MLLKTAKQAREFGDRCVHSLNNGNTVDTLALLNEILEEHTPFRLLDIIGAALDKVDRQKANALLDEIAAQGSEGGWVVIASALRERLPADLAGALAASRKYIMEADIWYGCDCFGERVPGPALVDYFDTALDHLKNWRNDPNTWVRRSLGVAGHFWTKHTRDPQYNPQARKLLEFLSPMLEERDINTAKGIGWTLKTMGRYYPRIAAEWLEEELIRKGRKPAAIVRRKALKFLPPELKEKFLD